MQSRAPKNQPQKEDNQLSQLLIGYLSYWPLFLIFIVLASGTAYFYLRYTIPKYSASASMIIKDEKKGYEDSKLMESLDIISTKKIIENETEILQSKSLIDSVVANLHLYAPISQEGKLRFQSAYISSPVIVMHKHPNKIKSYEKILLKFNKENNTVTLNNSFTGSINEWLKTPYGDLKFVPNPYYYPPSEIKPYYFELKKIKNVSGSILGSLSVSVSSKLSSILELKFTDEIPERAEHILNALIYYYNQSSVAEKNSLVRNTLASIENRLAVVAGDLDSIQQKIQQFKATNKAVELGTQGNLYLQNVGSTDNKLGEVNVQLSNLDQLEKFVSSSNNNVGILPSAIGVNDPTLTQLMTNLNTSQMEYEKLKKTVAENNPILLSLSEQINKIKPNILSNIQTQRRNLVASKNNLSSTSGKYNSMLNYIPQKERELLEISRDLNIKSGIYSFLLQKREESELSYTSTNADSKVINFAQADREPISPKRTMIYFAALIIGFICPILIVTGKELLTNKILYRKEIEYLTNIPIIGEIVHNKSNKSLVIEPGKRSFIAEEFRKIRVSLLFLGIDSYHKKILVTSSISGEGKSFIAANLAVSLAMTGKKVLLIDLDLHNPSLGKLFGIPTEEKGISDYLLGECKPDEIIRQVPEHDNLSFIPSGGLHTTPSELLENGEIQKYIAYLETVFDLIVIDTAPIVLVTDAYHLSSLADATLYVIRHKYTPKLLVKRIDENNKINTLKNPAIIFNGVKTRGFLENNYGYGYDYVYGANQKITKGTKIK